MLREQEPTTDPYKTLGLEPGASTAEIKRAYRLLAKAFHPDSAGEAAVPRFLAIQDAYEQLKTGKVVLGARAARPAPQPAAEPWRADPARAQAARERARTARNAKAKAAGATGAGSAGATGAGSAGSAGTGGPAGGRGSRSSGSRPGSSSSGTSTSGTRSGRRRDVRKATMGSTSYDEARDTSDATWSGASWYGPSSGEYWIVNPREYADPRKHGPEYQQRARRPLEGDPSEVEAGRFEGAPADATTGAGQVREAQSQAAQARAASAQVAPADAASAHAVRPEAARAPTSRTAASTWRTATGSAESAARPASSWAGRRAEPAAAPASALPRYRPGEVAPDADRVEAIGAASRAWLGGPADDPVRRLGLALVAWPPIGLAAAAAIGEATGCTQYAAACGGSEPLLPWLAQAAILGLLLLLPPIARLLAGGAIAVLIALVPITVLLLSLGGGAAPVARIALAVVLGVAWLAGIGWSARTFHGRLGTRAPP